MIKSIGATARRLVATTFLAAVVIGAVTDARAQAASDVSGHPWIGTEAPGFTLKAVGGDTLSLGDLRGRYVVVHFGASW